MIKISPSILSADFNKLGSEVKAVEDAGGDLIHIDIMDGDFVPNITIGPAVVKALRGNSSLPFDVHLMISNPDAYLAKFVDAGADIITISYEARGAKHLHRTITEISKNNCKAGVALNPGTPVSNIEPILENLDIIVIMSVNPGFPAQKFINSVLLKIAQAKKLIDDRGLEIDLEVDGGINVDTAPLAASAGATILVAGNAAFHGPKPTLAENIALLRDAANSID